MRTLDHARELFSRVDLEDMRETGCQDGGGAGVHTVAVGGGGWGADVDEIHFESVGEEMVLA